MPLFSYPLFFIAALSLPLLVVIYKLRNQPKSQIISSLMLWDLQKQPDTGGRLLKKLPLPLTLLLELIVLLMLVIATTTPLVFSSHTPPPLVVILDDSYSMNAGSVDSARAKGETAITQELNRNIGRSINFVLAGKNISTLGSQTTNSSVAINQLKNWHCRAPQSNINDAIAFSRKMFPNHTEILVVSDKLPEERNISAGIKWISVGEPLPNVAFTNATRTSYGDHDRYLFEISNMSNKSVKTALSLQFKNSQTKPQSRSVTLGPSETRKIVIELPISLRPLTAKLNNDHLAIDNSVTLLPQSNTNVKVKLNISDSATLKILKRALKLSNATITTKDAELIISDSGSDSEAGSIESSTAWRLQIHTIKEAKAYTGPFVVDKTHSINEGLFLNGLIWGASDTISLTGTPLITAANIPLLTEIVHSNNARTYQLQIALELSTLKDSTSWPILIWNLIEQRRIHLPGPSRNNYRLGEQAHISLDHKITQASVTTPDGETLALTPHSGELVLNLDKPGVWKISSKQTKYNLSVNTLLYDESDLTENRTETINKWQKASSTHDEYRSIAWIFLIIALLIITAHLYLIRRRKS